ncbi:MAG TPA: T9SS type A sorting domain-containing protein [Flavobacteriales bacterium]|nr:T9SS type A sorting domain-containing protein [Flavobacteriales bacterium]HNU55171.1 T9SS type A sorting domain-containing protein [Flavobacteriales bacterium]
MQRLITLLLTATAITLAAGQSPTLVGYEYWFDQNDADRTYVPVTPAQTVDLDNATLNTSGLALGAHVVNLRWKDQGPGGSKRWSTVVTRALQVGQPGPWEIVAVRYWVGNPTNGADALVRTKVFNTPQTTLSFNGLLELCGYPTGTQTLKLQLLDNHGQWSAVVTRPVNITPAGDLGLPTISASTSTICPGDVVTFTATPPSGPGIATPTSFTWQVPTGNGWSAWPSDSASIVVTIGDVSGTIQVTPGNLCGTGPTASLAVDIVPTPDQPGLITGPLQACVGSTVTFGTPAVPGLTYVWSITGGWTANGGPDATITTTIGASDATISVTPYNACGVAGPTREAAITVTPPPDAGADGSLAICSNGAPISLFGQLQGSPDGGGVWSLNTVPMSGIYDPVFDAPGAYVYTMHGSGPCPNASATVVVSETQAPNAGTDASLSVCSNATPVSMYAALGITPEDGGTWAGPSTTTGAFDPASMVSGGYTVTMAGTPPCSNASATVTVTVQQALSAGTGGMLELCSGSETIDLFNALGGQPDPSGSWMGPLGADEGIFTPGISLEGVFTYTVQGSGVCMDASAALEVNVLNLSLTNISGPFSIPAQAVVSYLAEPALPDADSILWTIPTGWAWDASDADTTDAEALLSAPPGGVSQLCAQAFGAGCVGNTVCFDVNVGIAEAITALVRVFPNPNNGSFTVSAASLSESMQVQVVNSLGQQVAAFVVGRQGDLVNLEDLPSGAYSLHWRVGDHSGAQRIVVAR